MKCEKCNKEFPDCELARHHLIPKFMGGTDKDGTAWLCKCCHQDYHEIEKIIFKKFSKVYFPEAWKRKEEWVKKHNP